MNFFFRERKTSFIINELHRTNSKRKDPMVEIIFVFFSNSKNGLVKILTNGQNVEPKLLVKCSKIIHIIVIFCKQIPKPGAKLHYFISLIPPSPLHHNSPGKLGEKMVNMAPWICWDELPNEHTKSPQRSDNAKAPKRGWRPCKIRFLSIFWWISLNVCIL